ncbi:MAG: transposase [Bacteroidales bacterium]|jgi:transposase|nr:transposase [Bacteroidales bacterium]
MINTSNYPTNLTDSQYSAILAIINDNRKGKYDIRSIFDTLFYLIETGCQWRMLPKDLSPWKLVYYYFSKWKNDGVFEKINEVLRNQARQKRNKKISPSIGLIDSQRVKLQESEVKNAVLMEEKT